MQYTSIWSTLIGCKHKYKKENTEALLIASKKVGLIEATLKSSVRAHDSRTENRAKSQYRDTS